VITQNDDTDPGQANQIFTSTYANKLESGGFRGFVHVVHVRGATRTEQEFSCTNICKTEEQALADALALADILPGC
jgi:hypothetical protein